MTQRELANAADTNETWISHIEAGRTNPAWGTAGRLAEALDLSLAELARAAAIRTRLTGGCRGESGLFVCAGVRVFTRLWSSRQSAPRFLPRSTVCTN